MLANTEDRQQLPLFDFISICSCLGSDICCSELCRIVCQVTLIFIILWTLWFEDAAGLSLWAGSGWLSELTAVRSSRSFWCWNITPRPDYPSHYRSLVIESSSFKLQVLLRLPQPGMAWAMLYSQSRCRIQCRYFKTVLQYPHARQIQYCDPIGLPAGECWSGWAIWHDRTEIVRQFPFSCDEHGNAVMCSQLEEWPMSRQEPCSQLADN